MKKLIISILILQLILLPNTHAISKVVIDYIDYEGGKFNIIVLKPDNEREKVLILEIYVNSSLYRKYYFSGNESYPIIVEIQLGKLKGLTEISARAYTDIFGWGPLTKIHADSKGIKNQELNPTRDVALLVGLVFLGIFIFFFFKKGK
jgi:hypothetical protein